MEANFWVERWRAGQIGFHEGKPNAFLEQFADRLGAARHVLVPLCGKAEDVAWLAAHGHRVTGIELVEDAVRTFFTEHRLTPREDAVGPFKRFTANNITLLSGDFFQAEPAHIGQPDAFYDRAAIVALPEAMRARYVQHLCSLLPAGAPGLTITFEYPPDFMQGPPFSVPDAELRTHYRGASLELLAEAPAVGSRFAQSPGTARERCYLITLEAGES